MVHQTHLIIGLKMGGGGKAPYKHFKYCDDFSRSKMDNHYFYLENKFYNSTSDKREDDEFMKLYRKKML